MLVNELHATKPLSNTLIHSEWPSVTQDFSIHYIVRRNNTQKIYIYICWHGRLPLPDGQPHIVRDFLKSGHKKIKLLFYKREKITN